MAHFQEPTRVDGIPGCLARFQICLVGLPLEVAATADYKNSWLTVDLKAMTVNALVQSGRPSSCGSVVAAADQGSPGLDSVWLGNCGLSDVLVIAIVVGILLVWLGLLITGPFQELRMVAMSRSRRCDDGADMTPPRCARRREK